MAASDPVVLAGYVDGIVLAVNMDGTRSDLFQDCYMLLNRTGTPILGYVLNNVKSRSFGYGRYGYKYYAAYTKQTTPKDEKGSLLRKLGRRQNGHVKDLRGQKEEAESLTVPKVQS